MYLIGDQAGRDSTEYVLSEPRMSGAVVFKIGLDLLDLDVYQYGLRFL